MTWKCVTQLISGNYCITTVELKNWLCFLLNSGHPKCWKRCFVGI